MKKYMSAIATTMCMISSMAMAANSLQSKTDKLSYTIGFKTGEAMKTRDVKINTSVFSQALADGYQGKRPSLSAKEMQTTLADMQKKMVKKMQAKFKAQADENAANGKAFLEKNAKKPGVKTTKSGLQYKVMKKGSGTSPKPTDTVTVNYQGSLINGTVFDSSYKRGKPATFKVNQVIKGWQQALTSMKPGSTWMLYIPSSLAYGPQGSFGKIGPNETLIFKVNLISVKK